jgi:hypothetical protein
MPDAVNSTPAVTKFLDSRRRRRGGRIGSGCDAEKSIRDGGFGEE